MNHIIVVTTPIFIFTYHFFLHQILIERAHEIVTFFIVNPWLYGIECKPMRRLWGKDEISCWPLCSLRWASFLPFSSWWSLIFLWLSDLFHSIWSSRTFYYTLLAQVCLTLWHLLYKNLELCLNFCTMGKDGKYLQTPFPSWWAYTHIHKNLQGKYINFHGCHNMFSQTG